MNIMSVKSFFRNKHVKLAIPFLLFMVGGSFGLREFTKLRYQYRPTEVFNAREEAKKLGIEVKNPEEVTLEAIYEKTVQTQDLSNWENKRIPRPPGWDAS